MSRELMNFETILYFQSGKGAMRFALRRHQADKAGLHFDLVIGNPNFPLVADFVIPKPKSLDQVGIKNGNLALLMEPHSAEIFLLDENGVEHVITEGYGKGTWETVLKGDALRVENEYEFILMSENYKYRIRRMEPNKWLIKKTSLLE